MEAGGQAKLPTFSIGSCLICCQLDVSQTHTHTHRNTSAERVDWKWVAGFQAYYRLDGF